MALVFIEKSDTDEAPPTQIEFLQNLWSGIDGFCDWVLGYIKKWDHTRHNNNYPIWVVKEDTTGEVLFYWDWRNKRS